MRFLLLLLTFATAPLVAVAADITLLENAVGVSGALVRLGDVAKVSGAGAERLADAPLMPSPAPGTTQYLSAGAVRDLLAAQGESASVHRLRGAYRIQITTPLGGSARVDAAGSAWDRPSPVASPAESLGGAFRVRRSAVSEPVGVRNVAVRRLSPRDTRAVEEAVAAAIQTTLDAGREADRPRLLVRRVELTDTAVRELAEHAGAAIEAVVDGSPVGSTLTAQVGLADDPNHDPHRVVAHVVEQPLRLVVVTPLSRGALVTSSSVRLEPVPLEEIDSHQSTGYTTLEEGLGREATRPLRIGEALSDANTAPPLMVRRNEEVEVVSGGGGVSVSMRVIATQEGRIGDLISVQMLDRNERFPARVVGPRRLAVLSASPSVANLVQPGGLQ
ncbi:flagellar basal body P-ring biosynthesis protein FlgA [Botrimarina colliarenosi]|uniref:Flagellar basal body P-ring biosynthesis protein FlgA n=1 Tax=Botrimarina colliarenosi TaxID=2528001 RepID=A0A5C6AJE5_9BACT|nr:flagellar basal body P-ring formation chaperone FlgA [Botrimarina colliarenosi]TWT99368.1 flagellar basal body P-ring biosynthesis protein FlgA [Botrimarina colliarenosi]